MLELASVKDNDRIIATITGEAGLGKTSLAATFPKPFFICTEDGIKSIPKENRPMSLDLVTDVKYLWDQLKALLNEKHDYETLVIDSVTQLDVLFTDHIMASDSNKPASLAQAMGGYGAGYSALSSLHGKVRRVAERLKMNVVFIAHSDTQLIDLPDQESYTKYTIRMHHKSVSHYIDNVDLVGQIMLDMHVKKDKKRAYSDGSRIIRCHATPSGVTKNRYGIEEDIELQKGVNPFTNFLTN